MFVNEFLMGKIFQIFTFSIYSVPIRTIILAIFMKGCVFNDMNPNNGSVPSATQPDTKASQKRKPNRLIHEKSPYLQQHAYNPVDWYPWGEEAFQKAIRENKPIFLSIGYSTCHWCHVMESESFEDEEVAKLLNENFVSIKVDREERPDIDNVYMAVCQAITGSGGWPLNIFFDTGEKAILCRYLFSQNGTVWKPRVYCDSQKDFRFMENQCGKHYCIGRTGDEGYTIHGPHNARWTFNQ